MIKLKECKCGKTFKANLDIKKDDICQTCRDKKNKERRLKRKNKSGRPNWDKFGRYMEKMG